MAARGEDVYCSLLLTDTYLPGALVLAHSLRDSGTTKKLAILVTLDTVSSEVVEQLRGIYDYVIPVPRIRNDRPTNLELMGRPDLHSAFTKINLWKQTQFRRIVYVDADVVAFRAVDELFDIPEPFAAAPDIGWPDLFNTGVMVITPNEGEYHALMALAELFDIPEPFAAAPDIGWPDLFNTGVMVITPNEGEYHALMALAERGISFDGADQGLLNMHFQNNYKRLSFTFNVTPSAHYQYVPAYRHFQSSIAMVHFIGATKPWVMGRETSTPSNNPFDEISARWWSVYDRHYRTGSGPPEIVQYFVKGEAKFGTRPTAPSWDAQRHAPPSGSHGEAANLPSNHYSMSSDTSQFVPPERYPSPPKNMYYNVPAHIERPKPIFPWESHQPTPSRVFAEDTVPVQERPSTPERPSTATSETASESSVGRTDEPQTPTATSFANMGPSEGPPSAQAPSSPWTSFPRGNAWDDVPEIDRYVDVMQQKQLAHRRANSRGKAGLQPTSTDGAVEEVLEPEDGRRRGSRVTDFPSEDDRPSLPVTPAPIRRPKFWGTDQPGIVGSGPGFPGEDEDEDERLPTAHGVPLQSEWDPMAQLQKLAKQQSEVLLQKLSGQQQQQHSRPTTTTQPPSAETTPLASSIPEPSYHGPSAQFEKGEVVDVHGTTPALPSEEERDVLEV